jgi:serine/threonine-protein kinase
MSSTSPISEVLLRWEELRAQGRTASAEELCAERPDLLEEVRRQLRVLEAVYRVPRGSAPDGETRVAPSGQPPESRPPDPPGYQVLGELGRGGMGVVYKARQTALNRTVALKMVRAGGHAGAAERARFRGEAGAAARLSHPNIVQVYEVGEHQGCPYLAMEYVDGDSLAARTGGTPLPPRAAAELVRTLARAVHYAHERGVVHRDLKPANILLAAACGLAGLPAKPQAATPKIADFGLARCLDEAGQTRTGDVLGTPSYMAPEQAEGRPRDVGPHTDVYALGAILYELLTGRPPFRGTSLLETLEQVRAQEPVPPRLLQPKVPRDLEVVCLKCLEKEPARRYSSAAELADDLEHFLQGEAIRARGSGVVEQLARLLMRSQGDAHFHAWGALLLALAPVPPLAQLPAFALAVAGRPVTAAALTGSLGTAAGIVVALWWAGWRLRPGSMAPPERLLRSMLVGQLMALTLLAVVHFRGPGAPAGMLAVYPFWAVSTGLVFFIMGGWAWGGSYLIGLAFFALSLLMPLRPEWSPLAMGGMLGAALAVLGVRLRLLSRAARDGA